MKRYNLAWLLVLSLAGGAAAAPAPVWINNLIVTNQTNIDATAFVNERSIFFDQLVANSVYADTVNSAVFQTRDTLYFTNTASGTMVVQPGFNLETVTDTGIRPAASFNNLGLMVAVDAQVQDFFFAESGTIPILDPPSSSVPPGDNTPLSSLLEVSAVNLNNSGTMLVGDDGLLQLNGTTLNLSGYLGAGTVSEVDTNAAMGRGVDTGFINAGVLYPFFAPAGGVYDLCWGVTNGASSTNNVLYLEEDLDAALLDPSLLGEYAVIDFNYPSLGSRNGVLAGYALNDLGAPGIVPWEVFPFSSGSLLPVGSTSAAVTPNYQSYVYSYAVATGTSATSALEYYYNIILVNTASADFNITTEVGFTELEENILTNGDPNAFIEGIVKFSAPVYDVLAGQTVTNSIYLLDSGQIQVPAYEALSSVYPFDDKPLCFEITRSQPVEWTNELFAANDTFDPTVFYTAGMFKNTTAPMTNSFYVAQVGRDVEVRDGLFPYTEALLGTTETGFPDITNEQGRIEIDATNVNMSNLTFRANGFLKLNAPTLTGTPAAADFGNVELNLGILKSPLMVSNLLPATYSRLLGDIGAYSFTWMNTETNDGLGTNAADKVTNNFHYHLLVVDQSLRSSFQPTALDATLRGGNVVLDDPLRVMGSALFQATNLTVNSNLYLTGAAGSLLPANVPMMKNLLIGSGGSVVADAEINLGVATSFAPINPTAQNTPILSITNLGLISSGQTEIQSRYFANGGTVAATNNGSILLSAMTNYLGAGKLGLFNTLTADADISLTATSIQVTNSQIMAGQAISGQLVLYATGELTDHYPNRPSTNAYVTNLWQVTYGFSLPVKPASGDLFATQITTLASNANQTIVHVWAGQDRGPTPAGFNNNEVIGHLILDRTTNAVLRFSAAGSSNAMYVDYLELRDLAYDDYHDTSGLLVDHNFKIYFANANVDPDKLQRVYTNIVWVPQFAGPNSTAYVQETSPGATNTVPMNAALRDSSDISSSSDGIVNVNNPFPLNNTNAGPYPIPSPSLVTSTLSLPVANTNGVSGQTFVIWTTGQGYIKTTNALLNGLRAGQTISLTAVPSNNWFFSNWSWPVAAAPALVTNPAITFQVPTNAFSFVTANFITNPFIALAGVYNGLFTDSKGDTAGNSGFVTFTLQSTGVFSGTLRMGATNYPFASQFNLAQSASLWATNGTNRLAVTLQLGQSALPDKAAGSVSNGEFDASLVAYHTPVWTAANPAPQAGSYTLVLPGNANAAASPGGDSYGTVTVDSLGNLKAIGTLADNVSFSQSVPLSAEGQWALYISPTGIAQPLVGWVAFDTNGAGGTPQGFSGKVTWIRAAGPGTLYTNGFTNTSVLLGSVYSAAFQKTNGLALVNPTLTLSGGDLPADVANSVAVSGLETYTSADKTMTLTISPTGGTFSGQYTPAKGKTVSLAGVVLQNAGVARGFFLGTNQSGAVLLKGN